MKNNYPSDEGLVFDKAFPPPSMEPDPAYFATHIPASLILDKIAEHKRDCRASVRQKTFFMALTITNCVLIGWVLRAIIFG